MSVPDKPRETAVRKAKDAGQQALGKLIGDDDACARADARLSEDGGEAPDPDRAPERRR